MSKQMTPCEKLGYKVGDEFEVVGKSYKFDAGDVVYLQDDDGTGSPYFTNEIVKDEHPAGVACFLSSIKKVAKLKPAKQALADAIHQSGGWPIEVHWLFSTSSRVGAISFWVCRPKFNSTDWFGGVARRVTIVLNRCLPNWHQCILSRDEYFTAYPEQVKVEICNETKHKVEFEMESESEVTIKVSDWHKNGELPPVGEVCIFDPTGGECYFNDDELKAKGHQVCILAHTKYKQEYVSVAVFKWDLDECCGVSSANACSFRPIRTEREKAIDEMVSLVEPLATYREFAGAIYDAGMYKEVK